jgi:cytochrome c-type biogenesis protein CcmH/NrfF
MCVLAAALAGLLLLRIFLTVAAAEANDSAAAGTPEEQQHVQQLEARAAELRARLCQQNSLIKQVIDKLRHLVDAFNMWESHERHLVLNSVQYTASGASAI